MNASVNPRALAGTTARITPPVRSRAPRIAPREREPEAPAPEAQAVAPQAAAPQEAAPQALTGMTPELRPVCDAAVVKYVTANAAKNKATREEAAAKRELERIMAKAGIKEFAHDVDGKTFDVTFATGETEVVDIKALYGKVDLPTFLSLVSTNQTAVKDMVGSVILASVLVTKQTDEAVKVKARK